jgi:hemoglobin
MFLCKWAFELKLPKQESFMRLTTWCRTFLPAALLLLASFSADAGPTLFEQVGGEPALRKSVDELVAIMESDDRINFTFADTDLPKFKQLLFEQLCNLTAGPCAYTGRTMEESHRKLAVNELMFNALAEDLYIAFDRVGVPYRLQNKVMALLAPMHKDIVK